MNLNSSSGPMVNEQGVPLLPGADAFSTTREPKSQPTTVLIADDAPMELDQLSKLLAGWGYEVITAAGGNEAFSVLEQKDGPSLAILDWMMPGMSGLEICQRARQLKRSGYVYIVLLTSNSQQSDVIQGLGSGADDYLTKPFDPAELRARLEIGRRITTQKALRASEDRFRIAFDAAGVGMALADCDRWIQVNQALCDLLGYTQEEALEKSWRGVTHPDDLAGSVESFAKFVSGDAKFMQLEKRYLHKTGAVIWVLVTVSIARQADGTPLYTIAQVQDISKRKLAEEAVRRSEAWFRAIAENASELIMLVQPDGVIVYASRAFESVLGYSAGELPGTSCFESLLHPEDHGLIRQRIEDAMRTGDPQPAHVRVRHKDGSLRTLESYAGIIRNSKGEIDQFVVTSRVVDDWVAAQNVLQEREEQLKLVLDSTAEAIYGIDLNGNCTFCNQAFLRMTGFGTMDEVLGQNLHRLIHHHRADGSPYPVQECSIYQAFRNNELKHVDTEVLWRTDGSCFPAEYWSYPVERNGEVVGCVVTFIDISERRLAEDALRNAHKESELFINSVPSILIGLDADCRVTRWNLAASHAFGLAKGEVQGKRLSQCGIKFLDPGVEAEIDSWQAVEAYRRHDNIRLEKHGEPRILALNVNRVFPSSEGVGFLVTGADITERKELESQLRQAQKLEAIGQLAAGIAHEINTPIQYVGDNVTFLKESWESAGRVLSAVKGVRQETAPIANLPAALAAIDKQWDAADIDYLQDEVPRALDQALDGVQRVAKIVRAMKEFSHPGSEDKRPVDINRAIETTITVARSEWKYVAEVHTSFDDSLPLVLCLAGELNQVMLNLIVNAAQAIGDAMQNNGGAKGSINISTKREAEWAEISIQDSGPGIPEGIRTRVFEPFFTTKPVGRGTGQGLTLAHTVIVKKHEGQIWFESELGKGTTFFVRLPLKAALRKEGHDETHLVR